MLVAADWATVKAFRNNKESASIKNWRGLGGMVVC